MATTRTVTVMFTDLVDSTATARRLDALVADQLRDSHFSLLRKAINGHGGREVKNLGDGVMAVFDSAVAALAGAEEIQRSIHVHNHTVDNVPLAVRVGLSLGEVVEEDNDYFGDPVVEAARLCALADGGQVLATQLLALATGRRATQDLRPLGPKELKGITDPVEVVEVGWTAPTPISTLDAHVPLPARCLNAPEIALVGRQHEFDDLTAAMKEVEAGNRQLVLVSGEPGIGKTTVTCAFARKAYDDGAIVLFGRADEDLGLPYQPWVEILQHLLEHTPRGIANVVMQHRAALARILPSDTATPQPGRPDADEAARYVMYEAMREVLTGAATVAPVVVVLDDVQWADAPSLALLRHLVSTCTSHRIMFVTTYRESDVTSTHPLADLLVWLHRQDAITRLSLRGLDDTELLAFMEAAAGQDMDADGLSLRDALLAETDGNPFFVTELLRHLVETDAIYQDGDRWVASVDLRTSGLPISVSDVVGRRVSRLRADAMATLAAAAVIGSEFDLSTLAATTSAGEDAVLDLVEAACEARLVTELGPEQYRFAHALVEHSLYDSLTPTRRARLHRRVAELIEADETRLAERVGELANHWAKATAPADATKAIDYAVLAGERALDRLAPDEALRWYGQALELLDQQGAGPSVTRARILVGLGNAERQTGLPSFRETLLAAAHLAQEIGANDVLITAAVCNSRGFISDITALDSERLAVLDAALVAVGESDSADRAKLITRRISEVIYFEDPNDLYADFNTALDIAHQLGDPQLVAFVIVSGFLAITTPDRLAERQLLADEALAAAQAAADPILEYWALVFRSFAAIQACDVAVAQESRRQRIAISERLGQPMLTWVTAYLEVVDAFIRGDLDDATDLAESAAQIGRASGQPDADLFHFAQTGHVMFLSGTGGETREIWEAFADVATHLAATRITVAWAYSELDQLEAARSVLDLWFPNGVMTVHRDMLWVQSAAMSARVVHRLGWREAAASVYEQLSPFDGQLDCSGVNSVGAVDEALALLAATIEDSQAARTHFTAAIALYERIGAAYFLARTQIEYGQWLESQPDDADQIAGRGLIETALATAQDRSYLLLQRAAQA